MNCPSRNQGEPCATCDSCRQILSGKLSWGVREVNAATDGGIDYVRLIRDDLLYSVRWHWVWIYDEAHRITPEASDALLKTLEEPPEGATFILVTTEPARLTATIRSRLTPFAFERVAEDDIRTHLATVADERGWRLTSDQMEGVMVASQGSPRDALRRLELVAHGGRLQEGTQLAQLVSELLALVYLRDFAAIWLLLDDLVRLVDPPAIREACINLVFDAVSGIGNPIESAQRAIIADIPQSRLLAVGTELSRGTVPRGPEGVAALRGLLMSVAPLFQGPEHDAVRSSSERGGQGTAGNEPTPDLAWLSSRCPTPISFRLKKPFKNGKWVVLKPCDHADCEVCAPELARDYLEALQWARLDAFVAVSLPRHRLDRNDDPRERLNAIVGKARERLGQLAWAWYAEEDSDRIRVNGAVRRGSQHAGWTSSELGEELARVFGNGTFVSVNATQGLDPDRDEFLSALACAGHGSRGDAVRQVAAHLEWNGRAILHTSNGLWLNEAGEPLGPPSPKDRAQKLGRRCRADRGEYTVTVIQPDD